MVKVSAVVSIYNAREFLRGRLDNLLGQQGVDLEIVAVICGSKHPEDYDVLASYAACHENITIIEQKRIPIYHAWNVGTDAATGEYICNANCDDRFAPWGLRLLSDALNDGADVAYSSWWCTTTPNAEWCGQWDLYRGDPVYYPNGRVNWGHEPFSYARLAEMCFLGPAPLWRKALWEKTGGFDASFQIAGDYDMWSKMALSGANIQPVPLYLGLFYHSDNQVSRSSADQLTYENWRIRHRYMEQLKARGA